MLDEAQSRVNDLLDTLLKEDPLAIHQTSSPSKTPLEENKAWTEAIDHYNVVAKAYNYRMEAFPSGLLAGMLNYSKAEFLSYSSFT